MLNYRRVTSNPFVGVVAPRKGPHENDLQGHVFLPHPQPLDLHHGTLWKSTWETRFCGRMGWGRRLLLPGALWKAEYAAPDFLNKEPLQLNKACCWLPVFMKPKLLVYGCSLALDRVQLCFRPSIVCSSFLRNFQELQEVDEWICAICAVRPSTNKLPTGLWKSSGLVVPISNLTEWLGALD